MNIYFFIVFGFRYFQGQDYCSYQSRFLSSISFGCYCNRSIDGYLLVNVAFITFNFILFIECGGKLRLLMCQLIATQSKNRYAVNCLAVLTDYVIFVN